MSSFFAPTRRSARISPELVELTSAALSPSRGLRARRADALEIVQEAFLRVYRGLDAFNGAASFFTCCIASSKPVDRSHAATGVAARDLGEVVGEQVDSLFLARIDAANPLDVLGRRELSARLAAAFEALPPYHPSVIGCARSRARIYEE